MNRRVMLTFAVFASLGIHGGPRAVTAGGPPWHTQPPSARVGNLAQEAISGEPLQLLHHLGGAISALVVEGPLAYVGMGPQLVVWDVSDGARPERLGESDMLPGVIADILVQDGFAYVSFENASGLRILDVGDPRRPHDLGADAEGLGRVSAMAMSGPLLLVATSDDLLRALDISRPEAPSLVGSLALEGPASRITISGDRLFAVVGEADVQVIDIALPAAPTHLTNWRFEGQARDLLVRDDLAVVVLSDWNESEVVLLDVVDPTQPRRLGEVTLQGDARDAAWVDRGNLLVGVSGKDRRGNVRVVDITSPSMPREVAVVPTAGPVESIAGEGDLGFAVTVDGVLQVIDLQNKVGPHRIGGTPTDEKVRGIVIEGDLAYLALDRAGLQVFDVKMRHAPRKLSQLATAASARSLVVKDHRVYLATEEGLEVIDVFRPEAPRLIGRFVIRDADFRIAILDQVVLLLGQELGLIVIDVTRPEAPRRVGSLPLYKAFGIEVAGDQAFIIHRKLREDVGVLSAVDLSVPAQPRIVAETQVHGTVDMDAPVDIELQDGLAFVACYGSGLWVVDVSSPAGLRVISKLQLPGVYRLALQGHTLVAGLIRSDEVPWLPLALWTIDVSQPERPRLQGGTDAVPNAISLAVSDGTSYIGAVFEGANDNQLVVVDVSDPEGPAEPTSTIASPVPRAVAAFGHQLLLAGPTGLQSLDPRRPMTSLRPLLTPQSEVLEIQAQGTRAYLSLGDGWGRAERIEIVDLTDPLQPRTMGRLTIDGGIATWAIEGDRAYLADDKALYLWDLANPATARKTAAVALPAGHEVTSLAAAQGHVYLVSNKGLLVFDVRDSQAPVQVGQLLQDDLDGVAIALRGNRALIGTKVWGGKNLRSVDISRPERPVSLSAAGSSDDAVEVAVDADRVILTDGFGRYVHLLELDRRGRLKRLDSLELPGWNEVTDLAILDGRAYLAAGREGLYVLDLWGDRPLRWQVGLPLLGRPGGSVP